MPRQTVPSAGFHVNCFCLCVSFLDATALALRSQPFRRQAARSLHLSLASSEILHGRGVAKATSAFADVAAPGEAPRLSFSFLGPPSCRDIEETVMGGLARGVVGGQEGGVRRGGFSEATTVCQDHPTPPQTEPCGSGNEISPKSTKSGLGDHHEDERDRVRGFLQAFRAKGCHRAGRGNRRTDQPRICLYLLRPPPKPAVASPGHRGLASPPPSLGRRRPNRRCEGGLGPRSQNLPAASGREPPHKGLGGLGLPPLRVPPQDAGLPALRPKVTAPGETQWSLSLTSEHLSPCGQQTRTHRSD